MGLERKDNLHNINDSMQLYYYEQIKGSFYKEVLSVPRTLDNKGIPNTIELATTWLSKKMQEADEIINNNPDDKKLMNSIQDKLAVYALLNRDFIINEIVHLSDEVKKTPEYKAIEKDNNTLRTNAFEVYKVTDKVYRQMKGFDDSLNANIKYPTLESRLKYYRNLQKEEVTKSVNAQNEEKRNQINTFVNDKVTKYQNVTTQKKSAVENYLTEKFTNKVAIDGEFLNSVKEMSSLIKEDTYNSVAEMATNYETRIINVRTESISNAKKLINNQINDLKEKSLNGVEEELDLTDFRNSDIALASRSIKNSMTEVLKSKLAIYMATKNARESRFFLTKAFNAIFRPTRERQEKEKIAQLRNELKETLHADDKFMDDLDKFALGKNVEPKLENPNVTMVNQKFDFTEDMNEKIEILENEETRKALSIDTNTLENSREKSEMVKANSKEINQEIQMQD